MAKVFFALDPANGHNRASVDLDKAPRDEKGLVGFSAELVVVRPKIARSNGAGHRHPQPRRLVDWRSREVG